MNTQIMRAKLRLESVTKNEGSETLQFYAVARSSYTDDGLDEDNSYAKWSPSAEMKITVANPNLFGKFAPGQKFYVDFTDANPQTDETKVA